MKNKKSNLVCIKSDRYTKYHSDLHPNAHLNIMYENSENGCIGISYRSTDDLLDFSNILFMYLTDSTFEIKICEFEMPIYMLYTGKKVYFNINIEHVKKVSHLYELIQSVLTSNWDLLSNTDISKPNNIVKYLKNVFSYYNLNSTDFIVKNSQYKIDFIKYCTKTSSFKNSTVDFITDLTSTLEYKLYDFICDFNGHIIDINFRILFEEILTKTLREKNISKDDIMYKNSIKIINEFWFFSCYFNL